VGSSPTISTRLSGTIFNSPASPPQRSRGEEFITPAYVRVWYYQLIKHSSYIIEYCPRRPGGPGGPPGGDFDLFFRYFTLFF
jgi:hypothetical protein